MSIRRHKIFPLGDNALTIEFEQEISVDINEQALQLAARIEQTPFAGLIETVPAYASTTVFYDVRSVRAAFPEFETAFEAVKTHVESYTGLRHQPSHRNHRLVEIPVEFSGEDLSTVAQIAGISSEQVVDIFIANAYRVYMLGFLPGFAYMGEVDERIAAPRRAAPRTKVPKGSVGIAGRQTGIYPLESPGGWQIIGYTSVEMFTVDGDEPCLLGPGDIVRFTAIDK